MKTAKTPAIKKIVKRVSSRLKGKTCVQIRAELRKMGYKYVKSGGYKHVYKRGKEPICVKVYRTNMCWKYDSFKVPKPIHKHFLHPVFKSKKFIIQQWAPDKVDTDDGDDTTKAKKLGIKTLPTHLWGRYDVRDDNVRVLNGKQVIVDFCY